MLLVNFERLVYCKLTEKYCANNGHVIYQVFMQLQKPKLIVLSKFNIIPVLTKNMFVRNTVLKFNAWRLPVFYLSYLQ